MKKTRNQNKSLRKKPEKPDASHHFMRWYMTKIKIKGLAVNTSQTFFFFFYPQGGIQGNICCLSVMVLRTSPRRSVDLSESDYMCP